MKKECECTDECLGYLTKECRSIEDPKKETRKEAAERFYGEEEIVNDYDISGYLQSAFLTGAKWQQEQIYNEIKELYDNENITGFSKRAYAQCLDIVEQFKKK
jgi:hypothetical protein